MRKNLDEVIRERLVKLIFDEDGHKAIRWRGWPGG